MRWARKQPIPAVMLGLNDAIRRSGIDRRTMLRWEPGKDDRRQGAGRREDDQMWDAVRRKL